MEMREIEILIRDFLDRTMQDLNRHFTAITPRPCPGSVAHQRLLDIFRETRETAGTHEGMTQRIKRFTRICDARASTELLPLAGPCRGGCPLGGT